MTDRAETRFARQTWFRIYLLIAPPRLIPRDLTSAVRPGGQSPLGAGPDGVHRGARRLRLVSRPRWSKHPKLDHQRQSIL
jgi:hypothetical protein